MKPEMSNVTDVLYKGSKSFFEIVKYDMSLLEYQDAYEAFEELHEEENNGKTLWKLLKEENPEYNFFKLVGAIIAIKTLMIFIKYKMKKFAKKYPEYTL